MQQTCRSLRNRAVHVVRMAGSGRTMQQNVFTHAIPYETVQPMLSGRVPLVPSRSRSRSPRQTHVLPLDCDGAASVADNVCVQPLIDVDA